MKKMIRFIAVLLVSISIIGTIPVSAMIPDTTEDSNPDLDYNVNDGFTYETIYAVLTDKKDANGVIHLTDDKGHMIPYSDDTISIKLHRFTNHEDLGVTVIHEEWNYHYATDNLSKLYGNCETIFRMGSTCSMYYTGYLGHQYKKTKNKSYLIQMFNYYISRMSNGQSKFILDRYIESFESFMSYDEIYARAKQDTLNAIDECFYAVDYNFARLRKAITKKQKALNAKDIWKKRFKYTKADKKMKEHDVTSFEIEGFTDKGFFNCDNVGSLAKRNKAVKKTFNNMIKIVNKCKTEEELNKVLNILETFDYLYNEYKTEFYSAFEKAWDRGINDPYIFNDTWRTIEEFEW